jgi:hypothetical protein
LRSGDFAGKGRYPTGLQTKYGDLPSLRLLFTAGGCEKVKALATVNDCKGWSFFRYRKIREISNKPLSAFLSETLEPDCTVNTDKKKVFLVGDFLTKKADLNSAVGGDLAVLK